MKNTLTLFFTAKRLQSFVLLLVLAVIPVFSNNTGTTKAKSLLQDKIEISGTIKDGQTGTAMPGVSVLIKGTSNGTITDLDGKYTITVTSEDILVFSFMGYLTEEIAVGSNTTLDISMSEDIIGLNEVIVTGYGVQKKSDLTGAVASVSAENLTKVPTVSIDQALQGRAAGVSVSSLSGIPGGQVKIQIRGITSVNGTDPLVVVDGVEGSLTGLNPNDIQSVEILKDAASAAIYGVSGGNGVIIVTTKKGQVGKMVTNFNYYRGYQEPWKKMDMMNSQEFAKMTNIVNVVRGQDPFTLQPDTLKNYDWQDMMFKTSVMDNYDVSFSGGSEKSNFFISAQYQKQNGILEKTDFNQYNFRINSEHKLTKYITIGENVNFNKKHSEGYEEWEFRNEYNTPLKGILAAIPFCGDYDEDGNWIVHYKSYDNPRVNVDNMNRKRDYYTVGGNFYANINPFKGFVFTSKVNSWVNFNISDDYKRVYHYSSTNQNGQSSYTKTMEQKYGWELQNYFNYNTTIASVHNIGITGGIEAKYYYKADMKGVRYDIINDNENMQYFDGSTNATDQQVTGGGEESSSYGYFGRLNYDYNGKYLLSGNLRYDVSSRFAEDFRVGVFPALSIGWKFSEESFMKNQSIISFGKIRAGYGKTGANAPDIYGYYNSVLTDNGFYNYIFNGSDDQVTGASIARLPNKEMHWETMIMSNVGLDLGFLNNSLSISVELFRKRNEDMLIYKNVPYYAGVYIGEFAAQLNNDPRPLTNIGSVNNNGFEFSAEYKLAIGELKANFGTNFSIIKNEVTDIDGDTLLYGKLGVNFSDINRTYSGEPMSQFYGYITEGIFTSVDEINTVAPTAAGFDANKHAFQNANTTLGDFKFKDTNHDGVINSADRTNIGNPIPKFIFGFNLNLEYKSFDFSLFLEGKLGQKIFNGAKYYYLVQNENGNKLTMALDQYYGDIYTEDGTLLYEGNTNTNLPRLSYSDPNKNFTNVSDFYVEDGSYVRLRNLQLGYTLPKELVNKIGIDRVRIYVGAKNLLTFTKYSGFDPEVGSDEPLVQGIDRAGGYPQNKMYLFGANLQF